MTRKTKQLVTEIIDLLSSPTIVFWALAWLMVLLVVGTIAQRYIGLYRAQQQFFSSYFFLSGIVPLPGGYPTMAVIFLGLVAKLAFRSKWRRENLGTIVTHLGALALLFGGFLTAAFSHEGAMVITEGQSADFISDYHDIELAVAEQVPAHAPRFVVFGKQQLIGGKELRAEGLPFAIDVVEYSRNSQVSRRSAEAAAQSLQDTGPERRRGFAANFSLVSAPLQAESERNQAGLTFRVKGGGPEVDGLYAIFENMPIEQTLKLKSKKYVIGLRRAQTPMPFRIQLNDFRQTRHPGTNIAASYESDVKLIDGEFEQHAVIKMNEPLRYKGYTLYQASFMEPGDENGPETSVLAVVHNAGRVFPYVSSIVMCVGLLLHLALQLPRLIRGKVKHEVA